MISKFFIERPVLANVIALLMVLIGTVALFTLPVAQYPNVVPPTVSVTTRYPGASAQTVIDTVALPIEQQVNGVQDMLYMQSTSASDGSYSLVVTFKIGTDLNFAQVLVQNRVTAALASLPQAVQTQGVTVQQKSTAILQFVALTGTRPEQNGLYLSNYATINLVDAPARLPGVGDVTVFGAGQYAMRVWLDPQQLRARGLTPQDVIQAIQSQSQQVTAGQVGAPPSPGAAFQYTVSLEGRLSDPAQFGAIIVKTEKGTNGRVTRVRDVGRVELGAQTYGQAFTVDGTAAAAIAIFQSPGANALQVAHEVDATMTTLSRAFPPGLHYSVPFDTTKFVAASIHEVYKTLIEAAVLVLIVILVFLQDWRAMLVPATTVPVTIIGAFAAMAALGFTINLSTLFAVVLAIGIVVDDAIVVVEGAAHHIDLGLAPVAAAIRAMGELFGPIMGITLVLMSVFLPAAFLPGLTGRLYAQFALVIAATALISAVNAATLKPTQCALWLRPTVPPERRAAPFRAFNALYDPIERGYARLIGRMARHAAVMAVAAVVLVGVGIWGILGIPTGFLPVEDQGYFLVSVQLPDGAALGRTESALAEVTRLARKVPGVAQVLTVAGVSVLDNSASLSSAGVAYVMLKDWGARGKGEGLAAIYTNLNRALGRLPDAQALVLPPPPIQGIGNSGGFTMVAELRNGSFDYGELQGITHTMIVRANAQSGLTHVASTFRASTPQLRIDIDRVKAATLHVALNDVFQVLSGYLGSAYVNQITKFGRVFQVYVQADTPFRARPADIDHLWVRNSDDAMIPLGTIVQVHETVGPSLVSLYNLYPAATINGSPAPGFSSGQAMSLMEQIAAKTLPPGTGYDWTAMSLQEKLVGSEIVYVFALAMLLVYLVLAGQYESWYAPISVIVSVPLALLGPAIVLQAAGAANNLYTQIGLIL
ncbi:MAG TPA: efflux RND transporter permease subunit, partial [Acetobacteraceae bacterium]|nr:efflux RND transporter permease subunit [Acetobacteraceae bacterium]